MTSYAPEYELQFYADDGTTPWGDPWTSYAGGTRPYLDAASVEWRQERVDTLTGESRIGEVGVRILDKRAGTDNADRILTQTYGDTEGRPNYNGRRARLRWRPDSGSSWRTLLDGRVLTIGLQTRQFWQIRIADDRVGFLLQLFGGPRFCYDYFQRFDAGTAPSYAAPGSLAPAGPLVNYRTDDDAVSGYTAAISVSGDDTYVAMSSGNILARVEALKESSAATRRIGETRVLRDLMIRATATSGLDIGTTRYYFIDAEQNYDWASQIRIVEGVGDEAQSFFADGDDVEFWIVPYGEASEWAPFHWRAHPATFLRDVLDGEFGPFDTDGAPARSFRYDAARLTALEAEAYPTLRDRVFRPLKTGAYLQGVLRGWALSVDADSQIYPVDHQHPATLPTTTLPATAEPIPGSEPWTNPGMEAIALLTFEARQEQRTPDGDPSPDRITEVEAPVTTILSDTYGKVTDREVSIPARAHRMGKLERDQAVLDWLKAYSRFIGRQYDRGPMNVPARVRTADADSLSLQVGMHVLGDLDWAPNPNTSQRGGTRAYQITTLQNRGPWVHLTLFDIGRNAFADAGTLTALAKSATAGWGTVDATVSVPDGSRVEFETAITDTATTTRPAADSSLWTPRGASDLNETGVASSETVELAGHAPSSRVWVRFRSIAPDKLTANWKHPTDDGLAADYVDLDVLAEVISATVSPLEEGAAVQVDIDQVSADCQGVRVWYGLYATVTPTDYVDVDVSSGGATVIIGVPEGERLYLDLVGYPNYPISGDAGPTYQLQSDVYPQPVIASFDLTFDEADDKLYATAVGGARCESGRIELSATSDFSASVTTFDEALADGDTVTVELALSTSDRSKRWFGRAAGYTQDLSGGAVAGYRGGYARDSVLVPSDPTTGDPDANEVTSLRVRRKMGASFDTLQLLGEIGALTQGLTIVVTPDPETGTGSATWDEDVSAVSNRSFRINVQDGEGNIAEVPFDSPELTVEATPYTGFSGGAVAGTAGETKQTVVPAGSESGDVGSRNQTTISTSDPSGTPATGVGHLWLKTT